MPMPIDQLVAAAAERVRKNENDRHDTCLIRDLLEQLLATHASASTLEWNSRWREIAKEPPRLNRFAIFWAKFDPYCFCPQVIGRYEPPGEVNWGGDFTIPVELFSHWMPLPKHPEFRHGR